MSATLHQSTITDLRSRLQRGEISSAEILNDLHGEIIKRDEQLGGYLSINLAQALEDASRADLAKPLGGIPIAIKDNMNVLGSPTTCGSRILSGHYTSPYDATVVRKLREAGAIPFGKTNLDEFAMGSSTENSALKQTRNPHDHTRVPGGSSGGSAAVVGADLAISALGSDTGGSIRQPASLCGCVGLKPSYGRVSRYGLVAYASSLDQIGPMTKSVEDAALVLQAIAGGDIQDSTSLSDAVPDYLANLRQGVRGMKIGLPHEYFVEGTDSEVRGAVDSAIRKLEEQGAELVPVSLPHTDFAVATYYIVATAEASANLARFDGVRYGHRCGEPQNMIDLYSRSREEGFGPEVKRRIILGTYVLSAGFYDAYYRRAQQVRTLIQRDFLAAFEKVDLLACPTCPSPAFKFGEKSNDPLTMYLEDIFTIAANLAGICGISLPCGWTAPTAQCPKLPIGLQLLGPSLGEAKLLQAAYACEQALR